MNNNDKTRAFNNSIYQYSESDSSDSEDEELALNRRIVVYRNLQRTNTVVTNSFQHIDSIASTSGVISSSVSLECASQASASGVQNGVSSSAVLNRSISSSSLSSLSNISDTDSFHSEFSCSSSSLTSVSNFSDDNEEDYRNRVIHFVQYWLMRYRIDQNSVLGIHTFNIIMYDLTNIGLQWVVNDFSIAYYRVMHYIRQYYPEIANPHLPPPPLCVQRYRGLFQGG